MCTLLHVVETNNSIIGIKLFTLYCIVTTQNLALERPTFQSTTYIDGIASYAVDGNPSPDHDRHRCSHTQGKYESWFRILTQVKEQILLEAVYPVLTQYKKLLRSQ